MDASTLDRFVAETCEFERRYSKLKDFFHRDNQLRRLFFKEVKSAKTILLQGTKNAIDSLCPLDSNKKTGDKKTGDKNTANESNGNIIKAEIIKLAQNNEEALEYLKIIAKPKATDKVDKIPFIEAEYFRYKSTTMHLNLVDQSLDMDAAFKNKADFVYASADHKTLNGVLKESYAGKKYIAIIYSHPTNTATPHTSLSLGKIDDQGRVEKIINIDGYDKEGYCAMQSATYSKRIILGGYTKGSKRDLQTPSWNDMNCVVYAKNYAKAVLEVQEAVIESAFKALPDTKKAQKIALPDTKEAQKIALPLREAEPSAIEILAQNIAQQLPEYYDENANLKTPIEKDRYHLDLRYKMLEGWFDECESAMPPLPKQPTLLERYRRYILAGIAMPIALSIAVSTSLSFLELGLQGCLAFGLLGGAVSFGISYAATDQNALKAVVTCAAFATFAFSGMLATHLAMPTISSVILV